MYFFKLTQPLLYFYRVGIHEHNITKRLKSFALCYSQLLLLADFCPLYGFLRLEFSKAKLWGGGGGIWQYVYY
jgi:hypothetical protein